MSSHIYTLQEKTGEIEFRCSYSLSPKKALIAFIRQSNGDFNTWKYPEHIEGIRESKIAPDHFYYDDIKRNQVIAAYPS